MTLLFIHTDVNVASKTHNILEIHLSKRHHFYVISLRWLEAYVGMGRAYETGYEERMQTITENWYSTKYTIHFAQWIFLQKY